jgi:hypothetical protein
MTIIELNKTFEQMTIVFFSKVRSFHIRQFLPLACTSKFGSWLIKAGHFQKPKQKILKKILKEFRIKTKKLNNTERIGKNEIHKQIHK